MYTKLLRLTALLPMFCLSACVGNWGDYGPNTRTTVSSNVRATMPSCSVPLGTAELTGGMPGMPPGMSLTGYLGDPMPIAKAYIKQTGCFTLYEEAASLTRARQLNGHAASRPDFTISVNSRALMVTPGEQMKNGLGAGLLIMSGVGILAGKSYADSVQPDVVANVSITHTATETTQTGTGQNPVLADAVTLAMNGAVTTTIADRRHSGPRVATR
jgi:hypothetical protein